MTAEATNEGLACVAERSPSAKLVYKSLEYEGAQTQSELVTTTGLSRNAVRSGTRALAQCGVVRARPDPTDARRKVYELTDRVPPGRN